MPKKSAKPAAKPDDGRRRLEPAVIGNSRTAAIDRAVSRGQVNTDSRDAAVSSRSPSAASADASIARTTLLDSSKHRSSREPASKTAEGSRRVSPTVQAAAAERTARPARRTLVDRLLRKDQ